MNMFMSVGQMAVLKEEAVGLLIDLQVKLNLCRLTCGTLKTFTHPMQPLISRFT